MLAVLDRNVYLEPGQGFILRRLSFFLWSLHGFVGPHGSLHARDVFVGGNVVVLLLLLNLHLPSFLLAIFFLDAFLAFLAPLAHLIFLVGGHGRARPVFNYRSQCMLINAYYFSVDRTVSCGLKHLTARVPGKSNATM